MDALREIAVMPHLWITPVVAGVVLAAGVLMIVFFPRDDFGMGLGQFMGVIVTIFGGLGIATWLVLLIPFDSKYHVLYNVDGEVTSVSNVLSEDGGDLTRVPVVQLDTLDVPAVVSDSRVVDLVGEDVTLLCSVEWVPYGMDRLNCSIGAIR